MTKALFKAVQDAMDQRRHSGGSSQADRVYELSNLLVCACGQTMIGHTTTNKNGRYRYFHYYHNVPGYVQTHKGYLLDAAHSEAMANELLGRPICQDWQNRLAEIIKKRAPIIVNDRSAEKLARAKELYVAGDITKDEYQTIKNGMTARTEPLSRRSTWLRSLTSSMHQRPHGITHNRKRDMSGIGCS